MAFTIGPLTTPFVPPSFCTRPVQYGSGTYGWYERDVTCGTDGRFTRASACFPDGTSTFSTSGAIGYFPAIACPVGWTADATTLNSAGQTTVACCPSGLTATGIESCHRSGHLSTTNTAFSCSGSVAVAIFPRLASTITAVSSYAIQIRLVVPRSSTFTSFTGSTSSSSASSSARPGASSSTITPTGAPAVAESEPKRKITGGAIAGIVIGVVVSFLLVIGAVLFLLRRRKQQRHAMSSSGHNTDGDLPEFVTPLPQPYGNSSARHSQTKIPPVTTEKAINSSLRTAVSPIPTTPTRTDTNELFLPTHTTHRTSDVSELTSPQQMNQHNNRDTFTTTSSATYPRSPLSELTSFETPHQSTINHNVSPIYTSNAMGQELEYQPTDRDSQVARLEAEKAMLDKLKARQLVQIEQEQATLQAELERLRGTR